MADGSGGKIVSLPPKTERIVECELFPDERSRYDEIFAFARTRLSELANDGKLLKHYGTVLQVLLRLRQLCKSAW